MKKAFAVLSTTLFLATITALPALADSSLPQPHHPHTHVLGAGGVAAAGGSGTAFTGVNVIAFAAAFVVLIILGVSALAIYREHTTAS
jgi:hypothetical protein